MRSFKRRRRHKKSIRKLYKSLLLVSSYTIMMLIGFGIGKQVHTTVSTKDGSTATEENVNVSKVCQTKGFEYDEQSKWDYDENIEKLTELLEFSSWDSKNVQERIEMLLPALHIEMECLGLPRNIQISVEPLDDDVNACYNHIDKVIIINSDRLDSPPFSVLETLIHEVRHAYQWELINLYRTALTPEQRKLQIFNLVYTYDIEAQNYVSGQDSDQFMDYYNQLMEYDARKYSTEETNNLYKEIFWKRWGCEPSKSYTCIDKIIE